MYISGVLEDLSAHGLRGLDPALTVLLPEMMKKSDLARHRIFDHLLPKLATAAAQIPGDDGQRLLERARMFVEEARTDQVEVELGIAEAFVTAQDFPGASALLDRAESRLRQSGVLPVGEKGRGSQESRWRHWLTLAKIRCDMGNGSPAQSVADVLKDVYTGIRGDGTAFESGDSLVEMARLWARLPGHDAEVVLALNEAIIAAYRPHEDIGGMMHPDPSARCRALCSVAACAHELRQPLVFSRVLEQATHWAETNPRRGQAMTELAAIAATYWKQPLAERSRALLLRAFQVLAQVEDVNPNLRPGIEKDEALSRVLHACSQMSGIPIPDETLAAVLAHIGTVEVDSKQLDLYMDLARAALHLPEPSTAVRWFATVLDRLLPSPLDTLTYPRMIHLLEHACSVVSPETRARVFRVYLDKIAVLEDGRSYGAVAAAAMQIADGLGDTNGLKDLSERFWERCQSESGSEKRTMLTGFVRAAERTGDLGLCNTAADLLFKNAAILSSEQKLELLTLSAAACREAALHEDALMLLEEVHAGISLLPAKAVRAQPLARIAGEYAASGLREHADAAAADTIVLLETHADWDAARVCDEIAQACALFPDDAGLRLTVRGTNAVIKSRNLFTLQHGLAAFAKACEQMDDTRAALDVVEQLEAFARKVIAGHTLSQSYMPAALLAPIKASYAVLLHRAGRNFECLECLNQTVSIGRDVLGDAREESPVESFVSGGMVRVCKSMMRIGSAAGLTSVLEDVESLADRFRTRNPELPNFNRYALVRELALVYAHVGERVRCAKLIEEITQRALSSTTGQRWRSSFFASTCGPFIYGDTRVLLDAAQDLSGEDVERVARDLHAMPAPVDEQIASQTYYALMRCASHSQTLSCLRTALLLWHIVAPFGRLDDLRKVLDAVASRARN